MRASSWKDKALRFRESALAELREGRLDTASFAANQAVELYLKGILIERTGMRPYTHSLVELIDLLKAIGFEVTPDVEECARELEPHYLQARYPDTRLRDYTEDEAARVECMGVILDFLKSSEVRD